MQRRRSRGGASARRPFASKLQVVAESIRGVLVEGMRHQIEVSASLLVGYVPAEAGAQLQEYQAYEGSTHFERIVVVMHNSGGTT